MLSCCLPTGVTKAESTPSEAMQQTENSDDSSRDETSDADNIGEESANDPSGDKPNDPECAHANTYERPYEDWEHAVYTDTDPSYHTAIVPTHVLIQCSDCWKTLATEENRMVTRTLRHVYTVEESWNPEKFTYQDNADGRTHTVTMPGTRYVHCPDCGIILSIEPNQTVTHTDWVHEYGEDGKACTCCGHVSACTHPYTEEIVYDADWDNAGP